MKNGLLLLLERTKESVWTPLFDDDENHVKNRNHRPASSISKVTSLHRAMSELMLMLVLVVLLLMLAVGLVLALALLALLELFESAFKRRQFLLVGVVDSP